MTENLNLNLPPPLADLNINSPIELQFEKLKKKGLKFKGCRATEEEKDYCEWKMNVNKQRDSYAGYLGHNDLINFFSISENETKERVKFILMEKMLQPCGPPPKVPIPAERKKKGKKPSKKQLIDIASNSKENPKLDLNFGNMSSEEISDDEDDKNEAFKDALQCSFVQQVFSGIYNKSDTNTPPEIVKTEKSSKGTFEDNVAKILARRLDHIIEECSTSSTNSFKNSKTGEESGIQLFSSGKIITNYDLIDMNTSNNRKQQCQKTYMNNNMYKKRAEETAVTPEWVHSKLNTKYWQDNKKPRIIYVKTIKSSNKDSIICHVLNDG